MHNNACTCILDTCTHVQCNTCIIILVEAAECSQYGRYIHCRREETKAGG